MDLFSSLFPQAAQRLANVESWVRYLNQEVSAMSAELDALKAAVALDAEMDAKFVAAVEAMVAQVKDLTDKLNAMAAVEVIAPADVQAVADQLNAHVADMSTHLPA